jgi:serine/threonine protein kinase
MACTYLGIMLICHSWHADLKPDNILIVNDEYKLADFGFAKFKGQGSEMPLEYLEGGTEAYGWYEHIHI